MSIEQKQGEESDGQHNDPLDDAPPAAYTDLLADITRVARGELEAGKIQIVTAFLIREGKVSDMIASPLEDDYVKDGFAEIVRQRASRTQADAIAMVSEAWSLPKEWTIPEKFAEHRSLYKHLADSPHKIDIVMLKFETYAGEWIGRAEVRSEAGSEARTFGDIEWAKVSGLSAGRFIGMLPVRYATPKHVDEFMALLRQKFGQAGYDPDKIEIQIQADASDTLTMSQVVEQQMRQMPADALTPGVIDTLLNGLKSNFPDGNIRDGGVPSEKPRRNSP